MAGRGGARKNGGRKKGGQNQRTIERAAIAEQIVEGARKSGKKLAIEVLDEFMQLFAGMAAFYQPVPHAAGVPSPNANENEDKFNRYAELAVETAAKLSKHQSPTFKAVHLSQAPVAPTEPMPGPGARAIEKLTPAQAYRLLKDADVIDIVPRVKAAKAAKAARG